MRKPKVPDPILDEFFFDDRRDYKISAIINNDRENFASVRKWLYLGADNRNSNFAKVGITQGDLASRSYSTSNPSYYLFCAFKFKYDVSANDMKFVENDIFSRLDRCGGYERIRHHESKIISECYDNVNFESFFKDLHYFIHTYHRDKFVTVAYQESGLEFIDCAFNKLVPETDKYIRMILQD